MPVPQQIKFFVEQASSLLLILVQGYPRLKRLSRTAGLSLFLQPILTQSDCHVGL